MGFTGPTSGLGSNKDTFNHSTYVLVYNIQLEDILKEFNQFTSPRVKNRTLFIWNKKRVILRTTVLFIGYTVKGTLFLLMFLHEYI